jgi:hypothetical protein
MGHIGTSIIARLRQGISHASSTARSTRPGMFARAGGASILGAVAMLIGASLSAAADAPTQETEARTLFTKFVRAQNAHDAGAVKAMLWNSPAMLWYTRGIEIRGPDAVIQRLHDYYEGTWHLEPDMAQFRATVITNDFVQILVPVVFTRAAPGKPPQESRFLISQTLVQSAGDWHVAAIMPIADTQFK